MYIPLPFNTTPQILPPHPSLILSTDKQTVKPPFYLSPKAPRHPCGSPPLPNVHECVLGVPASEQEGAAGRPFVTGLTPWSQDRGLRGPRLGAAQACPTGLGGASGAMPATKGLPTAPSVPPLPTHIPTHIPQPYLHPTIFFFPFLCYTNQ